MHSIYKFSYTRRQRGGASKYCIKCDAFYVCDAVNNSDVTPVRYEALTSTLEFEWY